MRIDIEYDFDHNLFLILPLMGIDYDVKEFYVGWLFWGVTLKIKK